ncbi:MAG TPA: protein kinase [Thermoanaerobaculia bacterium]|nr:protein kinase [Thermoanaerobaculia bacterium]
MDRRPERSGKCPSRDLAASAATSIRRSEERGESFEHGAPRHLRGERTSSSALRGVSRAHARGADETSAPLLLERFQEARFFAVVSRCEPRFPLLHAAGVIHRDVKSDNVFLHRVNGGEVMKVVDFGIAKLMNEPHERLTQHGTVGTPLFMAPERLLGYPYASEVGAHRRPNDDFSHEWTLGAAE